MSGAANTIANWIQLIFLQVYNSTIAVNNEQGLNFNLPLVATDNPGNNWVDITIPITTRSALPGSTSLPNSIPYIICEYNCHSGTTNVAMPTVPSVGTQICFVNVDSTGTTPTTGNLLNLTDANGYQFQDPETLALTTGFSWPPTGTPTARPRGFLFTLVVDTVAAKTFWACNS